MQEQDNLSSTTFIVVITFIIESFDDKYKSYIDSTINHVARLDNESRLIDWGFWEDRSGMMIIFRADNFLEAIEQCRDNPFSRDKAAAIFTLKRWRNSRIK